MDTRKFIALLESVVRKVVREEIERNNKSLLNEDVSHKISERIYGKPIQSQVHANEVSRKGKVSVQDILRETKPFSASAYGSSVNAPLNENSIDMGDFEDLDGNSLDTSNPSVQKMMNLHNMDFRGKF